MKHFSVTSDHFSLYEAFRKEAEKKGWMFNEKFGPKSFSESAMKDCNAIVFSDGFAHCQGVPAFAFSNDDGMISLEKSWNEAIGRLNVISKKLIIPTIEVTLSEIASWKKCDVEQIRVKL